MRRAPILRRCGAGLVASAALLLAGCAPESPGPAASPPPQTLSAGDFDDPLELLRAIEQGTFAQRAGLQREIRAAMLPERVTIEFVSGTEVPESQQDELRRLAEQLGASPRVAVDLIGCSDPSGSAQLNLRISQDRAESVAARLVALGVDEARLRRVEGRGEGCETQQRRVLALPLLPDAPGAQQAGADGSAETPDEHGDA